MQTERDWRDAILFGKLPCRAPPPEETPTRGGGSAAPRAALLHGVGQTAGGGPRAGAVFINLCPIIPPQLHIN